MDERRDENTMSDELLDRELAALLSAEPSPDFVARLRMHVESQARTRASWFNVRWIALAAALAVAVGAAVAVRIGQSTHVDANQARVVDPVRVIAATDQRQSARAIPPAAPTSARPVPEMLVSPSESRVVQRLLMAARGTAVVPAAHSAEEADAPLLPPMPITIEPITLEPLAAAADLESGVIQ
jgi:hypothetical protein